MQPLEQNPDSAQAVPAPTVLTPDQQQIAASIFLPHMYARQSEARAGSLRLAHYTTAAGAVAIIQSNALWLRNARAMQDFSEIQHGHDQLADFFTANDRQNLKALNAACDQCFPGVSLEAVTLFDQWWRTIESNTFIGCFSEHDAGEDSYGRLSMWRSFSRGAAGVALVFNPPKADIEGLGLVLSPVSYFSVDELHSQLTTTI